MKLSALMIALLVVVPATARAQSGTAADSAWARGDTDTAYRLYEARLARDSSDTFALHRVALVKAWGQHYAESIKLFDRLVRLQPENTAAAVDRARVLGWNRQFDDAERALADVVKKAPTNEAALELDAQVLSWAGKYAESLNVWDRLVSVAKNPEPYRLPHAYAVASAGKHREGIAEVDEILRQHPDSVAALEAKAQFATWAGLGEPATSAYDALIALRPDTIRYRLDRARALVTLGRGDAAFADINAVLARDSMNMDALQAGAELAASLGRRDDAVRAYSRLIRVSPEATNLVLRRAQLLGGMGRYDDALRDLEGLLAHEPTNDEALRANAQFASWAGMYARGVTAYERLLAQKPNDVNAMIGLGQVLSWSQQFDSANVVYNKILTVEPKNLDARRGIAQVATWRGNGAEGQRLWEAILQENPKDVVALLGLAGSYQSQGKPRKARAALRQVAAIQPDAPGLKELKGYVDRALAPSFSPLVLYQTDSDRNRVLSANVDASFQLFGPLELRAGAGRKHFEQEGTTLDRDVTNAQAGLAARVGAGWRLNGSVGVWQPAGGSSESITTSAAGLSSPVWKSTQASVTYQRSVYDVTALLANNPVTVRDFAVDAGRTFGPHVSLSASGSTAQFDGLTTNTRTMGNLRMNLRARPWVSIGPSIRAYGFSKDPHEGYWAPESYTLFEVPLAFTASRASSLMPTLELSPGYQKIGGQTDPWSASLRVIASTTYTPGPGRQIGLHVVVANSGLQQLSPVGGSNYRYRAVTLFGSWTF